MLATLWLVVSPSHVPTYSGSSCVTPPHADSTSQVVYVTGSGGLEIHIESDTDPFDTLAGELIDIDVVFRDETDVNRYSLYVGCGGCSDADPITIDPLNVTYEHAKLEPFTQTATRSVYPGIEWPKFNSSALNGQNCPARHFGIRLVDHSPDASPPIVWSAVVGKAERFSRVELLSFPLYILRNHGSYWNDQGWTVWVGFFVFSPLLLFAISKAVPAREQLLQSIFSVDLKNWSRNVDFFYALALFFYVLSALEMTSHFLYAQAKAKVGTGFFLFWGLVVLWGHAGLVWVPVSWWGSRMHAPPGSQSDCWSSKYWGLLDVSLGLVWLLYGLGGGLWLGPSALALAGVCRLMRRPDGYAAVMPTAVAEVVEEEDGEVGGALLLTTASVDRLPPVFVGGFTKK